MVLHASGCQGHLLDTTSNTSWFSDPDVDQWTLQLVQKMTPWRVPTRYFVSLQSRRLCISEFRKMYSRALRGHFKVWFYAHPHMQIFCGVLNVLLICSLTTSSTLLSNSTSFLKGLQSVLLTPAPYIVGMPWKLDDCAGLASVITEVQGQCKFMLIGNKSN